MRQVSRRLALLLLASAIGCFGQAINPNQIQPATFNGYILTTVTAGLPPSWQPPSICFHILGAASCC